MNALFYSWRISKYDPDLRDAQGHFQGDDWTFFAQVGQPFNGRQLTYEDYVSVENAYVRSVMRFLNDAGLSSLRITELRVPTSASDLNSKFQDIRLRPQSLQNNSFLELNQLGDVIRLNLREAIWCKLQDADRFYLHFGWDYYIYIGSTVSSLRAIREAEQDDLYVETKASPYLYDRKSRPGFGRGGFSMSMTTLPAAGLRGLRSAL